MSLLFQEPDEPLQTPAIPGFSYIPDYIKTSEESQLTSAIDAEPWDTTWKRRRQLYGAAYGDTDGARREIPVWAHGLIQRLHAEGISDWPFDQMLINEYFPGQGISLHRDYEPFDRTVVSLSLLSPCVMDFCSLEGEHRDSMLLEPRSLLVLSDDARYKWQHGIAARKKDRWHGRTIPRARRLSVTFRRMKTKDR
jgi:alkylated DNA repair dioxygenase AlkB